VSFFLYIHLEISYAVFFHCCGENAKADGNHSIRSWENSMKMFKFDDMDKITAKDVS